MISRMRARSMILGAQTGDFRHMSQLDALDGDC